MREYFRTRYLLRRIARWLVCFSVVLSPWLYGSADPWAFLLVSIIAVLGATVWLLCVVSYPFYEIRSMSLLALGLILVLFMVYQSIDQPLSFINSLSPVSAQMEVARQDIMIKSGMMSNAESSGFASISVSSSSTVLSLYLLVTYLCVFFVITNTVRSWYHLRQVSIAILASGFLLALVSVVHNFSGSRDMLWLREPSYHVGQMFGPFTNRNHYAFYMLMIFSLALGLFLQTLGPIKKGLFADWRERLAVLSSKRASAIALLGFVMVVSGGSIFISLSRGGMASMIGALGVCGVVRLWQSKSLHPSKGLVLGVLLLLIGAVWLGGRPLIVRLMTLVDIVKDPLANGRLLITRDTIRMFNDFPVFGCGFGSFTHIFALYQGVDIQFGRFGHAHNDWAQLLAEGGLVGAGIVMLFMAVLLRDIVVNLKHCGGAERRLLTGFFVGSVAVTLHSMVDFSLHKPANAILLSAMLGLAVATVRASRGPLPIDEIPKEKSGVLMRLPLPVKRLFFCILLIGLSLVVYMDVSALRGELAYARLDYARRMSDQLEKPEDIQNAVLAGFAESDVIRRYSGASPEVMGDASRIFFGWAVRPELEPEIRVHVAEEALRCALLSLSHAPSDYLSWVSLAHSQALLGLWRQADKSLQRANELRPNGHELGLSYQ